jgi:hypothetical protein
MLDFPYIAYLYSSSHAGAIPTPELTHRDALPTDGSLPIAERFHAEHGDQGIERPSPALRQ